MIKAKITSKVGASLEWELPANIHELHHALVEMGIRKTPRSLLLMDDNAANVELTADSEIGKGLLRVFGRNDTLADANTVAFAVSTAREEILSELEQKCAICNAKAQVHHVDAVGMGRDRAKISHQGMRAIALCPQHHREAHQIGPDFFDRHHVYGIKLGRELCKALGLKEKQEELPEIWGGLDGT